MFLRGRGIKAKLKIFFTRLVKSLFPVGTIYNAPRETITSEELLSVGKSDSAHMTFVFTESERHESPPVIFNYPVSGRFKRYYKRRIPAAYITELPGGMVYGDETNFVINSSSYLLSDVSREFGKYGGMPMQQSSVIKSKLKLPAPTFIKGKAAVISTAGSNNFHHWNYDCIPRIHLLKEADLFHEIEYFIISYKGLPFQKESLQLLGIDHDKIINSCQTKAPLFRADTLYIPSFPSALGTVSPWVIDFLRTLYNPFDEVMPVSKRIYLQRENVVGRQIVNNDDFMSLLKEFDIVEILPEKYTVAEMAKILSAADFIISIHGSGLSNLCFISNKTTVIDILAPYHQDCYYWMVCNIRNARYIGFFGEGNHPSDEVDLVKNKVDKDIFVDIDKMRQLLSQELSL